MDIDEDMQIAMRHSLQAHQQEQNMRLALSAQTKLIEAAMEASKAEHTAQLQRFKEADKQAEKELKQAVKLSMQEAKKEAKKRQELDFRVLCVSLVLIDCA